MATEEEQRLTKAYNMGYVMQQHEPELFEKILKTADKDNELQQTMALGGQQYLKDKTRLQQEKVKEKQKEKKRSR